MPEQTFRSPNFYEREVDLSAPTVGGPVGTPAAVIGTANKGPAFVPVTLSRFNDFIGVFGNLDPKRFGPYAVNEFLKYRRSMTFMRVLGAGTNATAEDIETFKTTGRVTNAGFTLEGVAAPDDDLGRHAGCVQFLAATHTIQTNESFGMPVFTDNDSYGGSSANLIRGVLLLASGARAMVLDGDESAVGAFSATTPDDAATIVSNRFKLVISSTLGNAFANTDGNVGVRILSASFNPTDDDYFGKILNTDPDQFVALQHLLYAEYPVDDEIATPTNVAMLSGSINTSETSGESATTFRAAFGGYDTRYRTPTTTWFISQPFGATEYDLFRIEALDDGEYANSLYKISITNIKASSNDANPYGTFTVLVRDWADTDVNQNVIEQFPNCSLDPQSKNYVAKVIGDRKVTFNFDATQATERRIITSGKYPNKSKYVRVVISSNVEKKIVPGESLPFGFRGLPTLKTNDSLNDTAPTTGARVVGYLGDSAHSALSGSLVPPIPFRYKCTRGETSNTAAWPGEPGATELANPLLSWGVKFERNTVPLNSNLTVEKNALLKNLTKFVGIDRLDVLLSGSGADTQNNNKFTLAKVAFSNGTIGDITGSANTHMREAAYIRNGTLDPSTYTINDGVLTNRITLATLLSSGTAAEFNKFVGFTKFTTLMYGGYDGLNFLDSNARRMNDKSTSFDANGGAEANYVAPGMLVNPNGTGQSNSTVYSYKTAIDIMTDPMAVNHNVLCVPGIRESFLTDYAASKVRDYGLAFFVMDIPSYDDDSARLYDDSTNRPSVEASSTQFDARTIDNNYAGTYFPDIYIDDETNNRRVKVPASIAVMSALGLNDKVAYPWFAPAGFNRAALDFVKNVAVRLNVGDRDRLYDARINPIATFPREGYVIYGQKTLQIARSALDRVNVRRMLLEIKRIVIAIARGMVFENNTASVRNGFVTDATLQLGLIQAQSGIEAFKVIMNETNNTQEDIDNNRLRGRIVVVPTRVIEFIAIDFIITSSGIQFV